MSSSPIRWSGLASMVGCMLLIVSDFLELLVVGYDLGVADYHGNLCHRNRADSARHSAAVGGAGRALYLPLGGRRLARVGVLMSFSGNALVAGPYGKRPSSYRGWHG